MDNKTFLNWTFNQVDGNLSNDEKALRLPPQQSKLLFFLIEHAGELLSRERIIEHVWQDKIVNEDALSRNIASLRSVLGDDRHQPTYIETIPKKGYRFIAPVNNEVKPRNISPSGQSIKKPHLIIVFAVFLLIMMCLLILSQNSTQIKTSEISQAINNAHRLTADETIEYQPDISKDGQLISYVFLQDDKYRTKVISVDGNVTAEISDPEISYLSPAIAKNNKSLLLASFTSDRCNIVKINLPTLNKQQITECMMPNESSIIDWSNDGKTFLYVDQSADFSTSAVWLFKLETKEKIQLTFPDNTKNYDTRPRFSPDNKSFSFIRGTHSIRNIFVAAIKNPQLIEQLTFTKSMIIGQQWVDNWQIIFDSNKRGDKYLWLFNSSSKELSNIGGKDGQNPSVDMYAKTFLFQEKAYQANLWKIDVKTKEEKKIVASKKFDNNPEFSPDGQLISFISNRRGSSDLWLHNTENNNDELLLSIADENIISNRWHASGKKLLVGTLNKQGYQCLSFDISTREIHKIQLEETQLSHCSYHPNGKIYAITKNENQLSQLISLNRTGSDIKILTTEGVTQFNILANGRIIMTKPQKNGFDILDQHGNLLESILPTFSHRLSEHWTITNNNLYFAEHQKEQKGTWKYNLKTKETVKITPSISTAIGRSMSVSPKEEVLIITKLDRVVSDLYISQ